MAKNKKVPADVQASTAEGSAPVQTSCPVCDSHRTEHAFIASTEDTGADDRSSAWHVCIYCGSVFERDRATATASALAREFTTPTHGDIVPFNGPFTSGRDLDSIAASIDGTSRVLVPSESGIVRLAKSYGWRYSHTLAGHGRTPRSFVFVRDERAAVAEDAVTLVAAFAAAAESAAAFSEAIDDLAAPSDDTPQNDSSGDEDFTTPTDITTDEASA